MVENESLQLQSEISLENYTERLSKSELMYSLVELTAEVPVTRLVPLVPKRPSSSFPYYSTSTSYPSGSRLTSQSSRVSSGGFKYLRFVFSYFCKCVKRARM
jgi:hypothetical protein